MALCPRLISSRAISVRDVPVPPKNGNGAHEAAPKGLVDVTKEILIATNVVQSNKVKTNSIKKISRFY